MHFQHPGHRIARLFRHAQFVFHVHPPQDEHIAVLLNITNHFCDEILGPNGYLARTQRAGKCAYESATCRSNHVVDGRCMRLDRRHVYTVVFRDRPVNTENDGFALRGQRGRARGTSQTSYFDSRSVGNIRHVCLLAIEVNGCKL